MAASGAEPLRLSLYTSRTTITWTANDLQRLSAGAADRNHRLNVTGRLLYLNGRFVQVIEGPPIGIDEAYCSIHADRRHAEIIRLLDVTTAERLFPAWNMDVVMPADLTEASAAVEVIGQMHAAIREPGPHGGALLPVMQFLQSPRTSANIKALPVQDRAVQTMDSIMRTTRHLHLTGGESAISFDRIAQMANVSIKTIYRYFSTPRDIIALLVRQHMASRATGFLAEISQMQPKSHADVVQVFMAWATKALSSGHGMSDRLFARFLREYHVTQYAIQWQLAGEADAALRRAGLLNHDDESRQARIAIALATLASSWKMARLYDKPHLGDDSFRTMIETTLLEAML